MLCRVWLDDGSGGGAQRFNLEVSKANLDTKPQSRPFIPFFFPRRTRVRRAPGMKGRGRRRRTIYRQYAAEEVLVMVENRSKQIVCC